MILIEVLGSVERQPLSKAEKEECLKILEESLQSSTKNYDDYFSSRPSVGTIAEDVAEVDAQISLFERQLKNQLVGGKDMVLNILLNNNNNAKLKEIQKELEQLWEIDNNGPEAENFERSAPSVDDFLGDDKPTAEKQDDEFHRAVKRLKERAKKESDSHNSSGNLAMVLENLSNITGLMELPFLARTCIKTGHYQEALMLYTYSKSLLLNFPSSSIVQDICANISKETQTTMLSGLVELLSTNVTVISLKKIVNYLVSIPPFDVPKKDTLLRVYLHMRFKFIQSQLDRFSIVANANNDSLAEMMVKRKIEVLREHIHMSISVFIDTIQLETQPLSIPLYQVIADNTNVKPLPTNPFILEFISNCMNCLLQDLIEANLQGKLNESVCLQLVYCSFRLHDMNFNYHSLFLNKIYESDIFTVDSLKNAIEKRRELQIKYSQ